MSYASGRLDPDVNDPINPNHYKKHPSGIECITITEHMSFNLGNAIKYIWRFPGTQNRTDLEKAKWYIEREMLRCSRPTFEAPSSPTPATS
jgi:hypothetical protein